LISDIKKGRNLSFQSFGDKKDGKEFIFINEKKDKNLTKKYKFIVLFELTFH
jgi:hypothetical protein